MQDIYDNIVCRSECGRDKHSAMNFCGSQKKNRYLCKTKMICISWPRIELPINRELN